MAHNGYVHAHLLQSTDLQELDAYLNYLFEQMQLQRSTELEGRIADVAARIAGKFCVVPYFI
jgi:hypothetical protein